LDEIAQALDDRREAFNRRAAEIRAQIQGGEL
jgi:hypothetical protein